MYLAIYNDGIIDPNSFRVVGLTSKRDDPSTVGFFGTGFKYALAVLARENIGVRIVSGEKRYTFGTKPFLFRGQDQDEITVGGQRLGFTSDLGPQWKLWMAFREIFCNALDEGGFRMEYIQRLPKKVDGTAVIVNLTDEVRKVMRERESWLILDDDDTEVIFQDGESKILKRRGNACSVFKRNVRVWYDEGDDCPYDFVLPSVIIDEKREASKFDCACGIASLLEKAPSEIRQRTLRHCSGGGILNWALKYYTSFEQEGWQKAIREDRSVDVVCSASESRRFSEELASTNRLVIPDEIHSKIEAAVPEMKERSIRKLFDGRSFRIEAIDDLERDALQNSVELLRRVNFSPMEHEIEVGSFVKPETLGQASDGKIRISRELLVRTRQRDLLETLMEEELHLLSGHGDKTRLFQDVMLSKMIDLVGQIAGQEIINLE